MRLCHKIILILSVWLLAWTSYGVEIKIEYLEDESGVMDIQAASRVAESNLVDPDTALLNFGYSSSTYWIKVTLPAAALQTAEAPGANIRYLEIGPPKPSNKVDAYVFGDDGRQRWQSDLNNFKPEQQLLTLQRGYLLKVDLTDDRVVWVRAASYRNFQLPISLWNETKFRSIEIFSTLILGLFYGVMLAMIIYNLFLFGVVRDFGYLYYVFYILSQLLLVFMMIEHIAYINDGNWPTWISYGTSKAVAAVAFTGLLFAKQFLDLATYSPIMNRVTQLLMIYCVATVFLGYWVSSLDYRMLLRFMIDACLFTAILSGLSCWRSGNMIARFYLLAWVPMGIGAAITHASGLGVLPTNIWSAYALPVGVVMEVLLLSIGLGYRINLLEREKDAAQSLALEHLEQANNIKDDFLANVSHELRTPLYGIVGLAETAIYDPEKNQTNEAANESLKLILASGQRLSRLVNDLLDFSAMNHNVLSLDRQSIDVRLAADTVLRLCVPLRGQKDITLENLVPEKLPKIYADEDRLQQILFNLVSNALKFTQQGQVSVEAEVINDQIIVRVSDTGMGIDVKDHKTIFESFRQLENGQPGQYPGTGIGLAVTKQLVVSHSGAIGIESALGQGATFWFSMAVAENQAGQGSQLVTPQAPRSSQVLYNIRAASSQQTISREPSVSEFDASDTHHSAGKILVVDDEYINLQVFKHQLRGFEVTTAQDGYQALTLLNEDLPDIVILDLMMPGMNGFEVCQAIRENHTHLPIIIVTAKNRLEDLIQGFESGANDYLTKPFLAEELRVRVHNQLQISKMVLVQHENGKLQAKIEQYTKAAAELKLADGRLEQLFQGIDQALLAFDDAGTLLYYNELAQDVFTDLNSLDQFEDVFPVVTSQEALMQTWQQLGEGHLSEVSSQIDIQQSSSETLSVELCLLNLEQTVQIVLWSELPSQTAGVVLIQAANQLTKQVGDFQQLLHGLDSQLVKHHPELITKLEGLDKQFLPLNSESSQDQEDPRRHLVELLKLTVAYWELATPRTRIELAIESKIWAVTVDDGRLRTRKLDRYLKLSALPKNPKWRDVIRTSYFVLSHTEQQGQLRDQLEEALDKVVLMFSES